ncbi:DNA cytosine methyltransferase [Macromonas bipunctata]|uniref:DNA cytosine methyltransferase n=1 Tax=Macromonas bipunctata TaxID=183670 RepID=UPI000C34D0C2|nr:DNA cytosine methyltransferase [Macromonas bipunctata]
MSNTVFSLFSGAGGCSLGFKQAGYSILYANDIDEFAGKSYSDNFPEAAFDWEDINKLDFKSILLKCRIKEGELDILVGGPPCQGFSTAGARFWEDPRNELLKSYVRALGAIKPKWFLMENVEGLLTAKNGKYLFEAAKAFIALGYKIRIEKIYAHEFGVPQRRKRVLIVGNRLGKDFNFPKPAIKLSGKIFRNSDVTLAHVIGGLPNAASSKDIVLPYIAPPEDQFEAYLRGTSGVIKEHFCPPMSEIQLQRIMALSPGQTMKDMPEHLQHESFKKRANRRVMDGTPTEKRGGSPSGLKRLIINEPCLTITGAATREFIHPTYHRPLTIRECARIQTFPDDFNFHGSASDKIQQIGNAIPPIIAKIFAEHIRDDYGFDGNISGDGGLIGYSVTKANAMSPSLKKTCALLDSLTINSPQRKIAI